MASQLVRINGNVVMGRWTPAGPVAQTVTPGLIAAPATVHAPSVATPPAATEITIYSPSGHKGRQTVSAASGSVSTGTVAPNADTLLLVAVAVAQNSGHPSDIPTAVSGLGLTWTKAAAVAYAFRRRLFVWWAYAGSAPTPGAITIPYLASSTGTVQDIGWIVVEVGGADSEGPLGTVTASGLESTGATSLSATISGTAEDGDRGFSFAALETTSSVSVENTLINQTGYTSGDSFRQLVGQWDAVDPQDTAHAFTWSPADAGAVVGFYVNAGGVRPRTIGPAVIAAPATVHAPQLALANSPQSISPGVISDPATVHAPTISAPTAGFPDATNTGVPAGTTLTLRTGYLETTSNGQIIQDMDIRGGIVVRHTGVLIRRCRLRDTWTHGHPESAAAAVWVPSGSSCTIEDSELDGTSVQAGYAAVHIANFTARRCNIHHWGEGLSPQGNCLIEDNYIHSFQNFVAQGAHQDGIQIEYGDNVIIRHNTIIVAVAGANSNIHVSGESHSGILVEDNLLASRGGKDMSVNAGSTWRNNWISVLLANYDTGYPDGVNGPNQHIYWNGGATVCGTRYYDGNPALWNSPTAGDYVERFPNPDPGSIVYDNAC